MVKSYFSYWVKRFQRNIPFVEGARVYKSNHQHTQKYSIESLKTFLDVRFMTNNHTTTRPRAMRNIIIVLRLKREHENVFKIIARG